MSAALAIPARPRTGRRSSEGFTLVELLVVIAIIGILVALLLPAVQAVPSISARLAQIPDHQEIADTLDHVADRQEALAARTRETLADGILSLSEVDPVLLDELRFEYEEEARVKGDLLYDIQKALEATPRSDREARKALRRARKVVTRMRASDQRVALLLAALLADGSLDD